MEFTGKQASEINATHFFPLRFELVLCAGTENLCRDFCLFFTPPGLPGREWMVVASAESSINNMNVNEPLAPNANPHSLTGLSSLDEVRFHLIDPATGKVLDRLKFSQDYILLSNHAGVSVNGGHRLGILSLQNQMIRIYEISAKGKFVLEALVGYKLSLDDEVSEVTADHRPLMGIKQCLFSHLFRRTVNSKDPREHFKAMRIIYSNWEILESLCMSRFQFLDSKHLLIKLVCPEALSIRSRSSADNGLQQTAFFVVYSLETRQLLSFHRSTSEDLYQTFRDYNDYFRMVSTAAEEEEGRGIQWSTTPSNDVYEMQLWERNVQLLAASKPSQGEQYAAKRLLLSLPFTPQSFSESPYLDTGLFRFDDRSVSSSERQRSASEFPVRFYSRKSDRVRFRLNSGADPETFSTLQNPYRLK